MKTRALKARMTSTLVVFLFVSIALLSLPVCVQAQYYHVYTLTVTVSDPAAGTVTPTYGAYVYGDVVQVTENTNTGYLFDGWYLNGQYQGKLSTIPITIYNSTVLNAVFSRRQAKLTITVNPPVGGNTAPSPQPWTYDYGITVPVKAYTNEGYVFDGWYLDGLYKGVNVNIDIIMSKDHQLDAYFATPQEVQPKPVDTRTPTYLAISCKSSTLYSHFSGQIDGFLTANGTGLPNIPIFVAYSVTGGKTWVPLTSVNTNDKGVFSATWMPDVTGDYLIKASWDGDDTYSEATTTVNFAVAQFQEKTIFSITSNSTISALSFDSNQSKLSFGVSGPNGTTGYVNLYVPKSLITDISKLKVYLDQTLLDNTYSDGGDTLVVMFSYNHSAHTVTVNLSGTSATGADNTTGWFPVLELAIASVIIIIAVAALVMLRRRKKSTKSI